ncbi:O-antigen ligase family protein [Desulfosarcina sp.]|uniref:O-antigen ligase family protein n=1 Tax=Desulfosarcina sp. TaxID=2027861 RepID=UPI003970692E
MANKFQITALVSTLLFLYLSTVNLVAHVGSTLSVLFAIAGIVLYARLPSGITIAKDEKWVLGMFVLYAFVYLLSLAINYFTGNLPQSSLKYVDDEARMLLIVPVFLLFRSIRLSDVAIWNGIVTGAILSGIHAVVFFVATDGNRASGSYDAIAFGDLSLALAVMSVAAYDPLIQKHSIYKPIIAAAFVLGVTASILSGSRGAWASIPLLFVILFLFTAKYIGRGRRIFFVALLCGIGVVAYLTPATQVAQRVDSAASEISDYLRGDVHYGGATVRLLGLQASMAIFADYPLIGAGPGSYKPMVMQMIAEDKLDAMAARHSQPSSTLFAAMASCGSLGLLAFLGMFAAPFLVSLAWIRRHLAYRNVGYALMMLSAAFFQFGLSEDIFRRSLFTSFYIIMVAAFMALVAQIRDVHDGPCIDSQR